MTSPDVNQWTKKAAEIGGYIGYYGLADWWLSAFDAAERQYIESVFKPMTVSFGGAAASNLLTTGDLGPGTNTAANLLTALAGWFKRPADRSIARRILRKAVELAVAGSDVLDLHFVYHAIIQIRYRDRNADETALSSAILACEKQIELAPKAAIAFRTAYPDCALPAHRGFEQLAIIREKQGDFVEAVRLASQAKQQGWAGAWAWRIERCKRRLAKAAGGRKS